MEATIFEYFKELENNLEMELDKEIAEKKGKFFKSLKKEINIKLKRNGIARN